jgi:hypothetical protein
MMRRRLVSIGDPCPYRESKWLTSPRESGDNWPNGPSLRVDAALEVQPERPVDPVTGFLTGFFEVEESFAAIMHALDHRSLNDVKGL